MVSELGTELHRRDAAANRIVILASSLLHDGGAADDDLYFDVGRGADIRARLAARRIDRIRRPTNRKPYHPSQAEGKASRGARHGDEFANAPAGRRANAHVLSRVRRARAACAASNLSHACTAMRMAS